MTTRDMTRDRVRVAWAADDGMPQGGGVDFSVVEGADDYEVVVSDEPLEGETEAQKRDQLNRDEIMRMIEEQKAAIAGAQNRGEEITALREGLADLGKSLKQAPNEAPVRPEAAFNEDEYKKKFNEDFYNDPYQFMTDFALKKLGPEFQRLAARQEEMLKRDLMRDPERADTMAKYRDEIEAEYQKIPAYERYQNPFMFEQAHDRVVARHINEIIEARVNAALEEVKVAQTQERGQTAVPTERKGSFQEPGGGPAGIAARPEAGSKPRMRLTTREAQWADRKGFTDRKAVEVLQRNPELRKVING